MSLWAALNFFNLSSLDIFLFEDIVTKEGLESICCYFKGLNPRAEDLELIFLCGGRGIIPYDLFCLWSPLYLNKFSSLSILVMHGTRLIAFDDWIYYVFNTFYDVVYWLFWCDSFLDIIEASALAAASARNVSFLSDDWHNSFDLFSNKASWLSCVFKIYFL